MPTFEKLRREMAAVRGGKLTIEEILEAREADEINDERRAADDQAADSYAHATDTLEDEWFAQYSISGSEPTDWATIQGSYGTRRHAENAAATHPEPYCRVLKSGDKLEQTK